MYEYDIRVGFSQSDDRKRMTITGIVDAFQDCSCFQSDDLGVGFDYLEPLRLVWIINYWEIEIIRTPRYGERLKVGTYPYDLKGFFGYRNFYLRDDSGYIVRANSLWVLMDWEHMRPTKVTEEMAAAYEKEPKLDMTYSVRKIALPEVTPRQLEPVSISRHHLDTNGHVNNGQYIKIAMEQLPSERGSERDYSRMRAEYRAQAHLGDTVIPVLYETEDAYTVSLNDTDGNTYTVIELGI